MGGRSLKDTDVAWLAGLLEGEGSFGLYSSKGQKAYGVIALEMTDLDVVRRAAELMEVGDRVNEVTSPTKLRRQAAGQAQRSYRVYANGANGRRAMTLILPFMGQRRAAKITEILKGDWGYGRGKA